MRILPSPGVALALAAALLAGCASSPSGGGSAALEEASPDADGLAIRGVVVDEAIRPLSNVSVAVDGAGGRVAEVETGAEGSFFVEVPNPGAYFLTAAKGGFLPAQAAVDVPASGQAEVVRVVLAADPESVAAIQAFTFHGYLECSLTAFFARLALCSMPDDLVLSAVCGQTGQCVDNVTDDEFLAVHDIQAGKPLQVQSEMVWESTQPLGDRMRAIPGVQNPEDGSFQDVEPFEGPSPLVMPVEGTILQSLGVGDGRPYQVRVFSSYVEETAPPACLPNPVGCAWGVGLVVEQEFQIFTHAFFGFRPREGWQFSVDGEPPLPG